MKRTGIFGIIYPIPNSILNGALATGKNIFIKNPVHETLPLYLSKGSKILFYVGKPDKKIIAEGTIRSIELLDFISIIRKGYSKKLMQPRDVLQEYCGTEFMSGLRRKLVFHIEKLKYLKRKIMPKFPITMTGKYINKSEYLTLVK